MGAHRITQLTRKLLSHGLAFLPVVTPGEEIYLQHELLLHCLVSFEAKLSVVQQALLHVHAAQYE
jgi:hypothetical protein